jgi:hypothetical protein
MARVLVVITIISGMFFPGVALAQTNYVMWNGNKVLGSGFSKWAAYIVSYKDGKEYVCEAAADAGALRLSCPYAMAPNVGSILTGPNVTTMPVRRPYPTVDAPEDFWQFDQQSGQLTFCSLGGTNLGCASFQLP